MSISFRDYLVAEERNRVSEIARKAVEYQRAIRHPSSPYFIEQPEVRELVLYVLEEIEHFVMEKLVNTPDPDEALMELRNFRQRSSKSLKELENEFGPVLSGHQKFDDIDKMLEDLFTQAERTIL